MTLIHAFPIINSFISNATLKLVKNKAKTKQHPEASRLIFENYLLSSSTSSSIDILKKCVSFNEVVWLATMKMRLKIKNESHRYGINNPRLRHGYKCIKYEMCLIIMMVIGIKQHLSNIWSSIHENVNPYVPNALFLYYLTVFWYFQEIEKGCIGNEWVN